MRLDPWKDRLLPVVPVLDPGKQAPHTHHPTSSSGRACEEGTVIYPVFR